MSRLSVAVCDGNRSYGESVSTWLFVEQGKVFSGGFFSSVETFQEQYDRQKFQVVLLGAAFIREVWIQEKIRQETSVLWIYLWGEGEEEEKILAEQLPVIEKYQPVPVLVRKMYRYYEEYRNKDIEVLGTAAEILGWFSPEQSIWQTPLALTMASLLAEKERVLYVTFKECSGFEQWFQEEYERDLLDVMYLCKHSGERAALELGGFVHSMEQLDYLPPVRDGVLLCELEENDYMGLIELLERRTSYSIIILDMGSMFPGFFHIWERCKEIYIPQEQNILVQGIHRDFREMLKRQRILGLEEKISWLSLPDWNRSALAPGCLMQQWIWGGQGDYVRELLSGRTGRN